MRPTTSSASRILLSSMRRVSRVPAPRRGAAFISSTTRMVPSLPTSATICRIELDPMSIAAMRVTPSGLPVSLAFVGTASGVVIRSPEAHVRGHDGGERSVLEMMLDLLPFGQVHRVLADVGREVGDPLEVAADEQELE